MGASMGAAVKDKNRQVMLSLSPPPLLTAEVLLASRRRIQGILSPKLQQRMSDAVALIKDGFDALAMTGNASGASVFIRWQMQCVQIKNYSMLKSKALA